MIGTSTPSEEQRCHDISVKVIADAQTGLAGGDKVVTWKLVKRSDLNIPSTVAAAGGATGTGTTNYNHTGTDTDTEIGRNTSTIVLHGGPMAPNETYIGDVCVDAGTYAFSISDSSGDGFEPVDCGTCGYYIMYCT